MPRLLLLTWCLACGGSPTPADAGAMRGDVGEVADADGTSDAPSMPICEVEAAPSVPIGQPLVGLRATGNPRTEVGIVFAETTDGVVGRLFGSGEDRPLDLGLSRVVDLDSSSGLSGELLVLGDDAEGHAAHRLGPDGTRIARVSLPFRASTAVLTDRLVAVDAEGLQVVVLNPTTGEEQASSPIGASEGARLRRDGDGRAVLFVHDHEGIRRSPLASDATASATTTLDGSFVAFDASERYLVGLDADGGLIARFGTGGTTDTENPTTIPGSTGTGVVLGLSDDHDVAISVHRADDRSVLVLHPLSTGAPELTTVLAESDGEVAVAVAGIGGYRTFPQFRVFWGRLGQAEPVQSAWVSCPYLF